MQEKQVALENGINFDIQRENMVIGYTTGVYDLFHIDHLNLLKNAKGMCDKLIVGVTVDKIFYDWEGPKRYEFRKDISMSKLTGNQKWQLWCAELFLNIFDKNK